MLTYASTLILGASRILWPAFPASLTGLLFAQDAVFELIFGLWLVIKAGDVGRGV